MKQNINKLIIAGALSFTCIISCDKKLEVLDENNPTTASYFKTAVELQNGVNAIYSSMRGGQLVGREWFFLHDMRGSETSSGGSQLEAPRAELLSQKNGAASNSVLTDVWRGAYIMINRANLILDKAPTVTDNTALRDRLIGETKFLRAWAYFELVSQWGDVPMYTAPVASSADFKGKSPAADVYALIISDLTDAAQKLPEAAPQPGRATKGAANALLGRVQMQKGDYAAAKTALLTLVGKYSLVPFEHNFDGDVAVGSSKLTDGHEFNAESIFEVAFLDKGDDNFNWNYNGEGATNPLSTVRPQEYGIVWGNVVPSNRLLNEFEDGDPRYRLTIYEEGDRILTKGGTEPGLTLKITGCDENDPACKNAVPMNVAASTRKGVTMKRVFRKYSLLDWVNSSFHPGGYNQRILRYADVLLMLAECEAEGATPSQAATYINMVRARPGVNMPAIATPNKTEAIKAVMHERAVELAAEEVNNIDILRWRKKGYYPSIVADPRPTQEEFLPIPAAEISSNPALK